MASSRVESGSLARPAFPGRCLNHTDMADDGLGRRVPLTAQASNQLDRCSKAYHDDLLVRLDLLRMAGSSRGCAVTSPSGERWIDACVTCAARLTPS